MDEKPHLDVLSGKLRLIEELWEKLVHDKWSREGLITLAQAVQDATQVARRQAGYEKLTELLAQTDQQISVHLTAGQLPKEDERERLQALLQAVRQALKTALAAASKASMAAKGEVLVLAGEDSWELMAALPAAGYQVRHLRSLAEVRAFLVRTVPLAAIVDMDCQEGTLLAGINMIAKDSDRIDFNAPAFFMSQRADLVARLEAVSAGSAGYFTKPLDMTLLLGTLGDRLREAAAQRRILIVNDTPKEALELAKNLADRGMITKTLDKPMEIIQTLYRFQPDLLLLNVDLREVSGLELTKAIRQYPDFESLPLILLAPQVDINRRLAALNSGADDLLGKPLAADYLCTVVNCHLNRAGILAYKLARLREKDTISGLYNRRYFLAQLQQLLAQASDATGCAAVMLITLDNLRAVAAMDIAASDNVVEQAASRLQMALAPGQQAARFGDAVFAVLCTASDREALLASARTLRAALETDSYQIGKDLVQLRISIGISIAEKGKQNVLSLIQQADLACSSAWVAGGDHIQIYTPQADSRLPASQEKSLLDDIRDAVKQQRMSLVFQPIVSMQGDPAERYEVLLRMYKEGREILPETVFDATQRHRLGMVLDRWVIAQSIRVLKERQGYGHSTTLFVNISPAVLRDNEFSNWIKGGLEKTNVPPGRLILEMAEATAEQHMQELREFLAKVKPLGCGFSLDRFSGLEHSLEMLKVLPIDYVKLDALLAHDLAEDKHKQQQLKNLAHQLSAMKVTAVASGVEKLPTLFALWSCGVSYVQGFFLQRPHEQMNYDFTSGAF